MRDDQAGPAEPAGPTGGSVLTEPAASTPGDTQVDAAALAERLAQQERRLDRIKTDFMVTVAHELRTPLTNISGFLAMLREPETGPLNHEQQHMLEVVARNTQRLSTIIDDLLVLTRVEVGALHVNHQEIEYGWLISSAIAAVAPVAGAAGVTLHTEVDPILAGRADPEQIDKLLANLLTNAVKFTPRGGRVDLRAQMIGDTVRIEVADTGIGVPESDQAGVFSRFFRAANAVDKAIPGTGLGLPIVAAIVEQHHGQVSLRSTLGVGTTVTVELPVDG